MKKLRLYVLKEVFKGLIPAFGALVLIMVLGFCVQLLHEGLDVVRLPRLMPAVLVYSVPVVLPAAFLTAVIMAFGRLSADNEIVAIRVGGVHLFSVIFPVCIAALLLSGVASFFQFEVVPQAHLQMKLLKYEAVKQILIDKVALSSQRRFSFGDWHVEYKDFRDGKMINLMLLKTRGGRPEMVTTAAEGSIVADPNSREHVLLKLTDCTITRFGQDELSGPGTMSAKEFVLYLRVASDLAKLNRDVKYLGATSLFRYARRLEKRVRTHPTIFANPDNVSDILARRMNENHIRIRALAKIIESCSQRINDYTVEDKRRLERSVELKKEAIERTKAEIEVLQSQKNSFVKEIKKLQDKKEADRKDIERLRMLREKLQEVRENVESHNSAIAALESKIEEARDKMAKNRREALSLQEEERGVEEEKKELMERHKALAELKRTADEQKALRSAKIRMHKRLVQGLSVFVFALIGIPLGIMSRGHSLIVAFGTSFAIVLLLFYPFLIGGQIMAEAGILPVAPAMWTGNGLTFAIGSLLMASVMRQ